jgi:hypothetical protein
MRPPTHRHIRIHALSGNTRKQESVTPLLMIVKYPYTEFTRISVVFVSVILIYITDCNSFFSNFASSVEKKKFAMRVIDGY